MTSKEIIRAALARAGVSQSSLSEKLEYSNKSAVGAILKKNNSLRSDVFCKWLDALGYEVIIRRKNDEFTDEWKLTAETDRIKSENAAAMLDSMK